jgi:hypothetical protein
MPDALTVAALGVLTLTIVSPLSVGGQASPTRTDSLQAVAIVGASVLSMDGPGIRTGQTW